MCVAIRRLRTVLHLARAHLAWLRRPPHLAPQRALRASALRDPCVSLCSCLPFLHAAVLVCCTRAGHPLDAMLAAVVPSADCLVLMSECLPCISALHARCLLLVRASACTPGRGAGRVTLLMVCSKRACACCCRCMHAELRQRGRRDCRTAGPMPCNTRCMAHASPEHRHDSLRACVRACSCRRRRHERVHRPTPQASWPRHVLNFFGLVKPSSSAASPPRLAPPPP